MRIRIFALLIVLFLLNGCAALRFNPPASVKVVKFTHVTITGPLSLWFPENTPEKHRKMLIEAARIQLAEFEADWGKKTKPVDVFFFNLDVIPCGDLEGDFWGCHYGPGGPIHVIMGEYMTASVLYHELVHHNYVGGDPDHEDILWETTWRPKQALIWKTLREKNKKLSR